MKKALATFLISATALGGSLAYANAQENTQTTSGSVLSTSARGFRSVGDHRPPMMLQNVQETKTNIDNGVKITRTSTDAATVQKLQSEDAAKPAPKKEGMMSDVTFSKVNITNGVEITLTSTSADTVKRLQEGPKMGQHRGQFPMDKVSMKTENLANGVKIIQTSTDAEVVKTLQSSEFPFPGKHEGSDDITSNKVNIDNGVEITLTSTNADTVKKLQEGPKMKVKRDFSHKGKKPAGN